MSDLYLVEPGVAEGPQQTDTKRKIPGLQLHCPPPGIHGTSRISSEILDCSHQAVGSRRRRKGEESPVRFLRHLGEGSGSPTQGLWIRGKFGRRYDSIEGARLQPAFLLPPVAWHNFATPRVRRGPSRDDRLPRRPRQSLDECREPTR